MDFKEAQVNPNPREKANILEVTFFTYTYKMFKTGFKKTFEIQDLYDPIDADRSFTAGNRLERNWNNHYQKSKQNNHKPSLLKALITTFWPEYLCLGVILLIMDVVVKLLQPFMLGKLLDYFRAGSTMTKQEVFYYAGALVTLNGITAFMTNQYVMRSSHYGMRARAACCALIYRKALRLSRTALGETASGKVVNLLSNDVSRFDVASFLIHHMWAAPLAALIVMYVLWEQTGYAAVAGMIPIFLVLPLQSYTGKLSAVYRKQTALKTDERIRLMDEIVSGIQVIKMYAWEKPFGKLIRYARKSELKIIKKSSYIRGVYMSFNLFTTRMALFCTLVTMALSDQKITTAKVFVFMSYFNILSLTMGSLFVRGISEISELLVGIRRLQEFMLNEEFKNAKQAGNEENVLVFNKVSAKWNAASEDLILNDINLRVPKGRFIGIIGPVGCGKSSLLHTILGELEIIAGTISVNGSISYASQDPWVFAATLRQNILFGQPYDKRRYNEVIQVCALEKDFKQFANGDLTLVGERGASLSGGQKARINLARAVYRDADIYLLDDPLSAVDIHVGKHLFEECIMGFLGKKTRILVTHQVYHLKQADEIVILNNGEIEAQGSFDEVNESRAKYARLLESNQGKETAGGEKLKSVENAKMQRQMSVKSQKTSLSSAASELSISSLSLSKESDEALQEANTKEMQEESSEGKVHGSLLLKYLLAGANYLTVSLVLFLFILSQALASGADYFVSYWANYEEFKQNTINTDTNTYIYIYTAIIIGLFVIAMSRSLYFYSLVMWSSQALHDMLFNNVIKATMRFFDTNPSGRILNRFSKDIGGVDELLPKVMLDTGQVLLLMTGSLVLVAVVSPFFLILIGFISILFLILRVIFLRSSKSIKRLEGMTRSPVFTHLNATLQGLTTIRAFKAQEILRREFDKHQDLHTGAYFMYIAASSAFGFYLDLLCFIFQFIVTFSLLVFGEEFGLSGGQVGLAITQATALSWVVQWGMRQSAELANQLMSVERVLEYQSLPTEKQPEQPIQPNANWPDNGRISFVNVGLKYDERFPFVLKNLSFVIQPREKIGIVGRTGAGKSSLISALFRLAIIEGTIEIDGIDCKDVDLQYLRRKISIIPQDPVLFSGTLRYNLDPFEEYPDDDLWRALEEVELKDDALTNMRLESRVMDRGANYSVGQRQLICLARALIRNNKILMMDEATANVDPQTDALIQKTIRRKFSECTVLTVAHRLNTIMDSDRVLVMESGTVVEFNHPYLLLQNSTSRFSKMVADTGRGVSEELKKIAEDCYKGNFTVSK